MLFALGYAVGQRKRVTGQAKRISNWNDFIGHKHAYRKARSAEYYSNQRTFDLSSGKYHSVCAEATMRGGSQILTCAVVGTPLSFNFMGSKAVDRDAEKMLASLS